MREVIAQHMHLIDNAKKACEQSDLLRSVCQYVAVQMDASLVSAGFLARILELVDMHIMDHMNILQ